MTTFETLGETYTCPAVRKSGNNEKTLAGCMIVVHSFGPGRDFLLVMWPKEVEGFESYVASARTIKLATGSPGWAPALTGWLFKPSAKALVLDAFKGFAVAADVAKIGNDLKQTTVTTGAPGTVTRVGNRLHVKWSDRTKFNLYLSLCRKIKEKWHTAFFSKEIVGWSFPILAAQAVVDAFGPERFAIDAETKALVGMEDIDEVANANSQADELLLAADDFLNDL